MGMQHVNSRTSKSAGIALVVCMIIGIGLYQQWKQPVYEVHHLYWDKFDTLVELIFYTDRHHPIDEKALQVGIEQKLDELNLVFSIYDSTSFLYTLNQSPVEKVKIPECLAAVIRQSLILNIQTGGKFDITVKPLVQLWNFKHAHIPDSAQISQAREKIGSQYLEIHAESLIYKKPGLQIDLGAISKGFIIDSIAHYLSQQPGIQSGLVNIGGDIASFGLKPADQGYWKIGIQNPRETDKIWRTISLPSRQCVTTSGDYFRFFSAPNGKRYSHIIDPQTGYPVIHHLVSVTIIAPDAMTADGLSTSVFALGKDQGIRFLEQYYPKILYVLITEENKELKEFTNLDLEKRVMER